MSATADNNTDLAKQIEQDLQQQAAAAAGSPRSAAGKASPKTSPAAKKRKAPEADDDGLNKTSNTQADPSLPGIPASKVTSLGNYVRMSEEKRKQEDSSILKPKNLTLKDWEAVPIDKRVLFVNYVRNLADFKLTQSDLSFDQFLASVEERKALFNSFVKSRNDKVDALVASNQRKISTQARNLDRDIRGVFQERCSIKSASAAVAAPATTEPAVVVVVADEPVVTSPTGSRVTKVAKKAAKKAAAVVDAAGQQ